MGKMKNRENDSLLVLEKVPGSVSSLIEEAFF